MGIGKRRVSYEQSIGVVGQDKGQTITRVVFERVGVSTLSVEDALNQHLRVAEGTVRGPSRLGGAVAKKTMVIEDGGLDTHKVDVVQRYRTTSTCMALERPISPRRNVPPRLLGPEDIPVRVLFDLNPAFFAVKRNAPRGG